MLTEAQRDRVWDYMDRAWEADKPTDGAKWARKALEIDPDQLDAFIILAKATDVKAEQLALVAEGARRGRKIWAEEIKRPAQSYFWQNMGTRPFMRNVHWLALLQWETGERAQAIENAKFLLRLNPNDNQGIRYLLQNWYPLSGNWDAFEKLLKRSEREFRTEYLYAVALYNFRAGNNDEALKKQAWDTNHHVPEYLRRPKKRPPNDGGLLEGYVKFGSEGEAWSYADSARDVWLSVPGALDWIAQKS
jgi:tetratricopeptide (TPR) repeat protein